MAKRVGHRAVVALVLLVIGIVVAAGTYAAQWLTRSLNYDNCGICLHELGLDIMLYMREHNGEFPPSMRDATSRKELLICPGALPTAAAVAATIRPAAQLEGSYCYTGNDPIRTNYGKTIIVFEPISNHPGLGAHVLYADGSIDSLDADQYRTIITSDVATRSR